MDIAYHIYAIMHIVCVRLPICHSECMCLFKSICVYVTWNAVQFVNAKAKAVEFGARVVIQLFQNRVSLRIVLKNCECMNIGHLSAVINLISGYQHVMVFAYRAMHTLTVDVAIVMGWGSL